MFAKKRKRVFPPGTFIPTPARVLAIIQLCIAFTVILNAMSYPFMGELFENKSTKLVYDTVMGTNTHVAEMISDPDKQAQYRHYQHRNAERFAKLPEMQREQILAQYQRLQANNNRTFFAKLMRSLHILFFEISPWKQAWMLLSIVVSLLLLKRYEGAAHAIWLLPFLALLYAINNQTHGIDGMSHEARLFPSEEVIVEKYLEKPLSHHILEQEEQLREGWQRYLVREWTPAEPSQTKETFALQVEEAEFAFGIARLEAIAKDKKSEKNASPFQKKESLSLLGIYVLWNLFLAWFVNKKLRIQNVTIHEVQGRCF